MIQNSRAVVLNKLNYGNSSLICNILTEDKGKVSIIAKGARNKKNPNSAMLQPLNYIDVIYYYKIQRNIQTLKEVSLIQKHYKLDTNYEKIFYALTIVDVINKMSLENSPCNIIFRLTKKTLAAIDSCKIKFILLCLYLQICPNLSFPPFVHVKYI